jgi:hypothetical protein
MKKSLVGDPIFWPGLVYSPININGLLFALGTVTGQVGLLFEEFSDDGESAICRRKTGQGWEKVVVALAVRSSAWVSGETRPDLLICWADDAEIGGGDLPVLALSRTIGETAQGAIDSKRKMAALTDILPARSGEDLLHRGESIMEFEETVRQLDDRIKKIKGG